MLTPHQKTIVIVDPAAFRRARLESFLKPWAEGENAELISLQPERAHARLIESHFDMLIYDVGGANASACEVLAEIQVLHTLHPAAALVILSDDISQVSIVAAMNSGALGYLDNSMAPDLALQALSFVLNGGTYFPLAAILAAQTTSDTSVDFPRDISRVQPPSGPGQQDQVSIPGLGGSFLQQQGSLFDEQATCVPPRNGFAAIQCAHPDLLEPQLTERQQAILCCLCRGHSNKVIARTCHIAESTVKIHVKSILRKIHVKNRTQAAIWAIRHDLRTASDPSGILATDDLFHNSPDLFISEDEI